MNRRVPIESGSISLGMGMRYVPEKQTQYSESHSSSGPFTEPIPRENDFFEEKTSQPNIHQPIVRQ